MVEMNETASDSEYFRQKLVLLDEMGREQFL
jgi:DNA mismatch repair ATPase MutS